MSTQRQRSALITSLPLLRTCVYIKKQFWKLADRYKCAQPIGEIFPTPPFSLTSLTNMFNALKIAQPLINVQTSSRAAFARGA
jgi:hypothetical protein